MYADGFGKHQCELSGSISVYIMKNAIKNSYFVRLHCVQAVCLGT